MMSRHVQISRVAGSLCYATNPSQWSIVSVSIPSRVVRVFHFAFLLGRCQIARALESMCIPESGSVTRWLGYSLSILVQRRPNHRAHRLWTACWICVAERCTDAARVYISSMMQSPDQARIWICSVCKIRTPCKLACVQLAREVDDSRRLT